MNEKNKMLMACGHIANSYKLLVDRKIPYCVICDCDKIAAQTFVIEKERYMKCSSCGQIRKSNPDDAFFRSQPNKEYDSFYCGCDGWD